MPSDRVSRVTTPPPRRVTRRVLRACAAHCLLAALLLLAAHRPVHAQRLLRWKFEPGQTFHVHVEQQTNTRSSGAGKPMDASITMQMHMTWKVEAVNEDGAAQMTQRFDRLQVSMKSGPAEPIIYDSAAATTPSGPAADMAAAVRPLLGADFRVVMTDRGAIREVVVPDATAQALEQTASATVKQLLTADGVAKILRQAAVELPANSVSPGDTWTAESPVDTPLGLFKLRHTYVLGDTEEVDGRSLEQITVTTEMPLSDVAGGSGPKIVGHQQQGTILFDVQAGRMSRSDSRQKLSTERPYREFTIKVETNSASVTTLSLASD